MVTHYTIDALGNTTISRSDANKNVTAESRTGTMANYGWDTDNRGSSISGTAYANAITSTGRWWDDETELYYLRARYYDCQVGIFIQRDPLEYIDGMSLYRGYLRFLKTDHRSLWSLHILPKVFFRVRHDGQFSPKPRRSDLCSHWALRSDKLNTRSEEVRPSECAMRHFWSWRLQKVPRFRGIHAFFVPTGQLYQSPGQGR